MFPGPLSLPDHHIHLPDGRSLVYAEYGAPQGKPLFFFHGLPGSRCLRYPDDALTVSLGVRLIVPDRPGMGLSDNQPGRRLLDWPADLLALADALGVGRFAVAGFSGGGPYAVACGCTLGPRLAAVGLLSGIGPLDVPGALDGMLPANRMGYSVGRWLPWFLWRWIFDLYYGSARRHPEKLAQMSRGEPPADWAVFAAPGVRQVFVETFTEAFRQGTRGAAWEGWLAARPWGFDLAQVAVPVHLWQGEADVLVTPAMGRYMAGRLPDCHAHFLPGEGHLAWITHWEEILAALTGGW